MDDRLQFLESLVGSRNDIQVLLFRLLNLVSEKQKKLEKEKRLAYITQMVIGVAFSAWRGMVLCEKPFDRSLALEHSRLLLDKVVSTNAILFPDEQRSQQWMGAYYAGNMIFRLEYLHRLYHAELPVKELEELVKKFRMGGLLDYNKVYPAVINCLGKIVDAIEEEL